MPTPRKTPENPFGLTPKQQLVIADAVDGVEKTGKLNLIASTKKMYNTHHPRSPASISKENFGRIDFRNALIQSLQNKKILGVNGKVEQRLVEGLDAITSSPTGNEMIDYGNRLKYVQELNKIAGVYSPDRKQTQLFSFNINMTEEEADEKIRRYGEQLDKITKTEEIKSEQEN